jgi:hypothetical protein
LRELKNQQEEFLTQARVHRQALVDYDAIRLQESRVPSQADPRAVQQSNALQLQGDSIQRLINLGSQNKDAEFRQELTRKRVSAEVAAASIEPQIDRLKRRIDSARKSSAKSDGSADKEIGASALDISVKLQEVGDAISRLQKAQSTRFLDDAGLLYRVGTVRSSGLAAFTGVVIPAILLIGLLLTGLVSLSAVRRLR